MPETGVETTQEDVAVQGSLVEPGDCGADEADGGESEKGGRGKYGRGFVYLSLEDAEKAVRKIDEHVRRMPRVSFAQSLGHPKPIGRFKHKLAALESYGLVTIDRDNVYLSDLAVEMLYGPTEQVRLRARAKAFLTYDLFKETFVQCPKNQDHDSSYVDDFVRVTLKIVNDRETFLRRFLESASFAGLLEGTPDAKAPTIRLRPAVAVPGQQGVVPAQPKSADSQWIIVAPDDVGSILDGLGLTQYAGRCDVSQQSAGDVAITMADGKITVEVRRPVRVAIQTSNMLADVSDVLRSLESKGFKA